ncbi:MAG TPA: putative zinc-binding metallopeptidase, partial [Naasia sp.]
LTEYAKRRLVRQLTHLGLPIHRRESGSGLAFELRAPADGEQVLTGHADGVITINLTEASDAHREEVRISLGEPYRTILGHLRHEIGHYYWLVLVDGTADLGSFRRLFGDDRQDYGSALESHYGDAADGEEQGDSTTDEQHISGYATMHPWEDFAESFAHYLHITDGLETAATVGVYVAGPSGVPAPLAGSITASGAASVADLPMADVLGRWHGYALGMNAMNRSMGEPDLYPFVITAPVAEKLDYIHELVRAPS